MSSGMQSAGEALDQAVAGFDPENHAAMEQYLHDLETFHETAATAFSNLADRLDSEKPFDSSFTQMFSDMSASYSGLASQAQDAAAQYQAAHQQEVDRIENPRPGEDFWDVSKQD